MSASNKRVVIELEKGPQDEGWQLDDGTNFLAYRQQPLGEGQLSEVADLVTYFIDHAEQLFEPGTTGEEDDVQHELAKAQSVGQMLFGWLVDHHSPLEAELTSLTYQDALVISSPPELMAIPWELLHDGHRFIIQQCALIRRWQGEPKNAGRFKEPFPLPLQILGLSYSSQGLFISADEHWDYVEEGLETLTSEELAKMFVLAREEDLEDQLYDYTELRQLPAELGRVDLLHVLAHGAVPADEEGSGVIILGGKPFTGDQFASFLLGPLPDLRLVILASCKSGRADLRGHLKSVARACLQSGVPAVVAMQDDISPLAAELFVASLYRALAEGKPLDQAVHHGKQAITRISGTIEWATPVLYTTLDDLSLFLPLSPEEIDRRRLYLELLRQTTSVLPDDVYLPVEVSPASTVGQKSLTQDVEAVVQSADPSYEAAFVYTAPEIQAEKRSDARWAMLDSGDAHPVRRVTVLLGDAGSGKTTIIDKLVGVSIPYDEHKEVFFNSERQAVDPAAYIPLRLHLGSVGIDPSSYELPSLMRQAMAETTAKAEQRAIPYEAYLMPPDQDTAEAWTINPAWRFLIILEGLEAVSPENRREVGKYIRYLIQAYPRHRYILTATTSAFAGFVPHLGQYTQWQITRLSEQTVRKELKKEGLRIDDDDLINLLRHPWALITLKKMQGQGITSFDQAGLLRGRISQILDDENLAQLRKLYLKKQISLALAELALQMERGWEANQHEPSLAVDEFFAILKAFRGERTYDLEELFAGLINADILNLDQEGPKEVVRFSNPYVHAILAALALEDALNQDAAALQDFGVTDPRFSTTLILLVQIDDSNIERVVGELIERLDESQTEWVERLGILDLAVRSMQHKPRMISDELRCQLIRELGRCLLHPNSEEDLESWVEGTAVGAMKGARLSTNRLPRASMRVRVAELFGYLKDWSSFEPLRWLIMDRIRGSEQDRFARSTIRQAAAESMQQLWRAHVLSEQRLADYPRLYLFLKSWSAIWTSAEKESLVELEKLISWLIDDKTTWLQSIAVVPISDIAIRHPNETLAQNALQSLAQTFRTSQDEDTIWMVASSATEFSYLPAGSAATGLMAATFLDVLEKSKGQNAGKNSQTIRQEAAAYALGKLRRTDALGALCELLSDREQDYHVQARAAKAIGECGLVDPSHRNLPQARQMLLRVAGSHSQPDPWNPYVRRKAIGSLGHLGGEGATDVLLEIIRNQRGDEGPRLRTRATFALQQLLGREAAVDLLQSEIPSRPVRGDYARTSRLLSAMALIGDERAAEALLERQWSAETIKKLDEQEWIFNLRQMKARQPQALPPKFPGHNLRFLDDSNPERQMKGPEVKQLETRLWQLGYAATLRNISGHFSRDTEYAVKAFQQRSKGLNSTGVVDIPTWRRLFSNQACQGPGGLLFTDEAGNRIAFQGNLALRAVRMAGADVRLVQSYLWDLGYGDLLEVIDGVFSSATQRALMAWQRDNSFLPTGVLEQANWNALQADWERNDKLNVRPGRPCLS